ncbi:MAG: HAD family hydrolase [Deltaproteobacteria bacterium]|nr:HAD family hydrolase [Deltaproteobacteria bacterium]
MKYKAIVSSDWNECLAPSGPFDPISFTYPDLEPELSDLFVKYTGNQISLSEAAHRISLLVPTPITEEQMDAYLDASFATYSGVPDLIEWLLSHDIFFMLNTTGTQGYFQRAFARNLIPAVPIVAAGPIIRFPGIAGDLRYMYQVVETRHKPKNTESVMNVLGIHPSRVVIIGDSGGDGPHFEWGFSVGAYLISSMTKHSLSNFCEQRGIAINKKFGVSYLPGEKRDRTREMQANFLELTELISAVLGLQL